ncbi:hypothetical protein OIU76_002022 [Salix suchowensis]|nr:hypothetical protein OIU76_002022 [Salix suchowensis]
MVLLNPHPCSPSPSSPLSLCPSPISPAAAIFALTQSSRPRPRPSLFPAAPQSPCVLRPQRLACAPLACLPLARLFRRPSSIALSRVLSSSKASPPSFVSSPPAPFSRRSSVPSPTQFFCPWRKKSIKRNPSPHPIINLLWVPRPAATFPRNFVVEQHSCSEDDAASVSSSSDHQSSSSEDLSSAKESVEDDSSSKHPSEQPAGRPAEQPAVLSAE